MQKVWSNIFLIMIGYIVPVIIIRANTNNEHIYTIQLVVLLVILATGGLLTYINNQNRKIYKEAKAWFIIFEILGILGILYSLIPLYFIFAFRNGVNF